MKPLAVTGETEMTQRLPMATKRLVLRRWQEADRQPFATLSSDPEVMRYLMPLATRAFQRAVSG